MSNLSDKTLTELVGLIKSKQIKSEELTDEFIANSQKGKKLNAYITESFDTAKDKAKQFDVKPNFDPGFANYDSNAVTKLSGNFIQNSTKVITKITFPGGMTNFYNLLTPYLSTTNNN